MTAKKPPPPQLTSEQAHGILDEVIPSFATREFQRKMRERWDSTEDYYEKVKLRQELCLEIQGPVLAKYGYKPTPAGVSKSSSQIMNMMPKDPELSVKGHLNNWLVSNLDYGDKRWDLEGRQNDEYWLSLTRMGYKVSVTRADDSKAIRALERLRSVMVETHQALYQPFYPDIRSNEWLDTLGSDTIKKSLESGIVMLHAESLETGEVAGYISCTEGAENIQFVGNWSCSSDPSLTYQIVQDDHGQLRVDGIFSSGTSAGSGTLASHGKWLEARLASRVDGRRFGVALLSIAGPGRTVVRYRATNDTEFGRDAEFHRVGRPERGQDEWPHIKINHVVVSPGHNGRGVGKLLFEDLLAHLGKGPTSSDLRLSVVEQNARAISWYFKLGFSIVDVQLAHIPTLKHGHVPVVFLEMQRRRGVMAPLRYRLFGKEVLGEKVVLVPDCAPTAFLAMVQLRVFTAMGGEPIRLFDEASGRHELQGGRTADLSEAFSRGMLLFERPLHIILTARA